MTNGYALMFSWAVSHALRVLRRRTDRLDYGIIKALKDKGAKDGDTVRMGLEEFDFLE